jgi:hypothetical protein
VAGPADTDAAYPAETVPDAQPAGEYDAAPASSGSDLPRQQRS